MSSDMNLFDLLDDSFLKADVKDELFVDHNYGDIITVSPELPGFSIIPFASFFVHLPCVTVGYQRILIFSYLTRDVEERYLFNLEIY